MFGRADTGVVNKFQAGTNGQVSFNDNLGISGQVGAAPMVLKHDLGVHTDEPASAAELKEYMSKLRNTIETKYKLMRSAFRALDEDGSGRLSKEELVQAVQHFSLPIPLTHIHEIFDTILDVDSDGHISFNEFTKRLSEFDYSFLKTEEKMQKKKLHTN